MRILLDKNIKERLRHHLAEHDVHTVRYMGWGDLPNGALLEEAVQAGYHVLLTGDKKMKYTQNLAEWDIQVVEIDQQAPLTDDFVDAIRSMIGG